MHRSSGLIAIGLAVLAAPSASAQLPGNSDEANVGPYELPDPLVGTDGLRVIDRAGWSKRRAEILDLFEHRIYGQAPPPRAVRAQVIEGGVWNPANARRMQVRLTFAGLPDDAGIDLLIYLPRAATGPVPLVLGLNFRGNQAIAADPAIRLSGAWLTKAPGIVAGRATKASRGIDASEWPVAQIIAAGYGVATFAAGDVFPDRDDGRAASIQRYLPAPGSPESRWGAIATWAWGLSRALDWLRTRPEVDEKRVIVLGHSRFGKVALWTGARDPRFAMVVSNNSGEGGASLYRRNFGETIAVMNDYWFAPRFKTYVHRETDLPIDSHMLMALVAPRPLYIASASEDWWADPTGEFLAARAAGPVYQLFGHTGVPEDSPPGSPVGGRLRYHVRSGAHAITGWDWARFLEHADLELR